MQLLILHRVQLRPPLLVDCLNFHVKIPLFFFCWLFIMLGQISRDVLEPKMKEEEEVKQSSSRLLAGRADSAIQILAAQNEELRDEVESLRCQLELEQLKTEQHVNGTVNGSTSALVAETKSNGSYLL